MSTEIPANFSPVDLFPSGEDSARISSTPNVLTRGHKSSKRRAKRKPEITGIDPYFLKRIAEIAQRADQDKKTWQEIFEAVYTTGGIESVQTLTEAVNSELEQAGSTKEINLDQQKEDPDLAHFAVKNKGNDSSEEFLLKLRNRVAESIARSIAADSLSQQETEKAFQDAYRKENQAGIAMLESSINRSLINLHRAESIETQPCGLQGGSLYFIIKSPENESGFLIFPQERD